MLHTMATNETNDPVIRDVAGETPAPTVVKPRTNVRTGPQNDKLCDLHGIMALENEVHKGTGTFMLQYQVPDFRLLNLAFLTYIGRVFHNANFEPSELVTPPALIAYLNICMAFLLFMNDHKSADPSFYSREFSTFSNFNRLFNALNDAVLPPALAQVFQEHLPWSPDLLKRLEIVPSLAATMPSYDIPYLMHPLLFLHGHNHLFARANGINELVPYLMQSVFTFTSAGVNSTGTLNTRVGNLLGCLYNTGGTTNTNLRYMPNWLSDVVLPFVNPATHRQHLRRTGLVAYNLDQPTYTSGTWNPYTYFFGTDNSTNFNAIISCVRACSVFVRDELKGTVSLSSIRNQVPHAPGSYMITSHIAPTWHVQPIEAPAGTGTGTGNILPSGSFDEVTSVMKFGENITTPPQNQRQPLTLPTKPTSDTDPTPIPADGFLSELYLVEGNAGAGIALPTGLTTELKSAFKHVTPDVLVFLPGDSTVSASSWCMLAGIAIYNGNVDSTTFRAPNSDDSISLIRSRYVDGFVSCRLIRPKFADRPTYLVMRQALKSISFGGTSMIYQSDKIFLPRYHQTETLQTNSRWNLLWPFTLFVRAILPSFAFSAIPNQQSGLATQGNPDYRAQQIFELWSSFRAMSCNERPSHNNVYFGVNPGECLFGRNSTLNKFPHPATLLHRP
uniref:Capsid protein n=1 Tax=Heterobasidion partitivirus 23 TaxID=3075974 RepID=A0AA95Z5P9_9VIRU|nr:capsid protein [Heterobasidion partitivirus 23]